MEFKGNLTIEYWVDRIIKKRNKVLSKIDNPVYFQINLSIDPVAGFYTFNKSRAWI